MKILLLLLFSTILFAHTLSVNAVYEDGELYIESMFGNGDACKGCGFVVKHNEKEILKGVLDSSGSYEQKVTLKAPFRVYVDGGMGHQADLQIDASDIEQTIKEQPTATTKQPLTQIDEESLRKIIKSELNKQNVKIKTMIEKNRSTTEQMIMGLGYILGIFGLWQLFARKYQK